MKKNNYKRDAMERYKVLCNIMEKYNKDNVKCICITSNSDDDGKTMIAKNLAISLAKYGKKVLFIDCNLFDRVGVKSRGVSKVTGLTAMLQDIYKEKTEGVNCTIINYIQLKNYIIDCQLENLSMLPLGVNSLNNFGYTFKTEYLRIIMENLKTCYDYLIVDAPSFINLSYTQIVSAATDGCLFVLKEGVNEVNEGDEIKERIATIQCKVLGCIFNKGNDRNKVFDDMNNSFINVKYIGRKSRDKISQKVNAGI